MEQHTPANSRKNTAGNLGKHTAGNSRKPTTTKDAKQLLSSAQYSIRSYKVRKEAIRASKEEIDLIAATERKTEGVFPQKFETVIQQIRAYRYLLNAIMKQVDIDVQIEFSQSRLLISKLGCDYRHYVLFAIASRTDTQSQSFNGCDFLAFHGDADTNHINVYEYTEVPVDDAVGPRHFKRRAFKEYAKHLSDDHIDKFNIEDMAYYMERYIDKQLKRIITES